MSVKSETPNLGLIKYSRGHSIRDGDLGTNMDILDAAVFSSVTMVSTTLVPLNATGQTTLYTVPADKIFIPVMAVLRIGADASTSAVTLGRVGALTDFLGTISLANLDADGDQGVLMPVPSATPAVLKTYAAAVVFQIDVTTGNGGATNYVDLFGYLVDA